jgi:spore maturation protein CgeB
MRIFYAAEYQYPIQPGSRLWYNNLYLPLSELGYDIVPFDYNITPHFQNSDPSKPKHRSFIEKNRPELEYVLLKQVRDAHREKKIDVFFSYFYSAFCRPEIIEEIRRLGIVTINWYCNASYQFHLVSELAPAYDYCLVPEEFRLDDYRRIGANPIYFQEGANPNIYKPYNLPREFDVTFVGQQYGDRWDFIHHLIRKGIRVNVWGTGWRNQFRSKEFHARGVARWLKNEVKHLNKPIPQRFLHGALCDDEMIRLYSRSKISLGFSSVGNTHRDNRILQIRLRDFEAPMTGAFYMTEYMEELEEFFEIGKEIVCYHDKYDLGEKIKYYLGHDAERERIRQAGYQRALKEHTWQKRFAELFNKIRINAK